MSRQTRTCRVPHLAEMRLTPGRSCSEEEEEEGTGLQAIWQREPSSKHLSHILRFSRKSRDLVRFPQGRGEASLPAARRAAALSPGAMPQRGPDEARRKPPSLLKTYRQKPGSREVGLVPRTGCLVVSLISALRNVFSCDAVGLPGEKNSPGQAPPQPGEQEPELTPNAVKSSSSARTWHGRAQERARWHSGSQPPCATARNPAIKSLSADDARINHTHIRTDVFMKKAII